MKKTWQICRGLLAILLACSLTFGLCANGLTALATETPLDSSKDDILKDFFGDDLSPEEAYDLLLSESANMEDYENQPFQYVPKKSSFYVALGDETAAKTKKQTSSYVNLLADALGISYENLASPQMPIQDVYATITENSSTVAKADLITIGFSNYGATYFMCQYMAGQVNKVTEKDWIDLVGEENVPHVQAIMDQIFQKISDQNISADQFGGYDLEGGLECYIYTYMSNAIHQGQVIEAIRVINPTAAIVIVGTYNDLDGVSLSVNGGSMDLGSMMNDLVNSSNYLSLKNSQAYDRVAYVDAKDVSTALDANASKYTTPKQYVFAIVGRQGLPNADGHTYIKNQIMASISKTCTHTWNEGVVAKEPTCKDAGTMKFTCTWCGETMQESIPATGEHTLATREENRKEATCGAAGSYDLVTYCTGCGMETNREKKTIPVSGEHSYGSWKQTKAPTCTEAGEEQQTCKVCGHTQTRTVAATGHNYQSVVTRPTCTEDGYTTYICACGDSYVGDEVPALGHHFGSWTQVKAPTCSEKGEEKRTCTRCALVETREVDTVDHQYTSKVTSPTCTEAGYTTYTCSTCGYSYVGDEIPALGHHFGSWTQVKAPTCTEKGEEKRTCTRCGVVQTREIDVSAHNYRKVVTQPTCTEEGYTTYTCADCGDSYVADKVAALGHAWQNSTQSETCCEDGLITSTCSRCGETKTQVIPANGKHDLKYTDNKNGTSHSVTCGNSGKVLNSDEQHTFAAGICTKCGANEYCKHQWNAGEVTKAPTCVATGEKKFTCANCGESYTEVMPVNPSAHTGVTHVENKKDATCKAPGYTGDTVCECGTVLAKGEETAKTQHTYGDWIQIKAPTCTEKGQEQRTCVNCGNAENRSLDMLDHTYEAVVTAPTCTEEGYTTYTCVCGDFYITDEVPAVGHTWVSSIQKETCCEIGLISYTCRACGEAKTEVIPANGKHELVYTDNENGAGHTVSCGNSGKILNANEQHTFVGGVCEKCGAQENCKHQWNAGEVTKAPTCVATGEKKFTCTSCGESHTEVMPVDPSAHTGVTHVENAKAPSCKAPGYTGDTVCECGAVLAKGEEIAKTQHTYGDWIQIKAPTCTEKGQQKRVCANCGYAETRAVDMIAHAYKAVVTAPTCTEEGYTTYTCVCGDFYIADEVAALGHAWTSTVKNETCCEDGLTTNICDRCAAVETKVIPANGEHTLVYTDNANGAGHTVSCGNSGKILNASEQHTFVGGVCEKCGAQELCKHQWNAGEVTKAPTCVATGEKKFTCTSCGESHTEVMPVDPSAHTGVTHVENKKDATCKAPGYTGDTVCECGTVLAKGEETAKTQHAYGDWFQSKAPTCTEKGQQKRVCANCGNAETRDVDQIAHEYKAVVTKPTCIAGGYTTYTCTMCGASYVSDYTDPVAHNWDAGVVTKEPTADEDGVKTFTCTVCGATKTEAISKLGDVDYELPENGAVSIPENDCFEGGTTVKVEQVQDGDIFDRVQSAMKNREESYVVFEFTATKDGVSVQPDGKLTVTFAIPAGYSTNVALYYMNESGKLEQLQATVDAAARTITVELTHFSTYILADKDTAPELLLGDVNGDGRVNVRDARALLRQIAGLAEEDEVNEAVGDINGDGRINVRDARALLRQIAGLD